MQSSTSVTLCINSDHAAPDFWTRYFDVKPDFLHHKDEPFKTPSGRTASGEGRLNAWLVHSAEILNDSMDEHLKYLIGLLKLPRVDLPDVLAENFSTLLCFYTCNSAAASSRPILSSLLLDAFSQSGIVIVDGMV